jgi:two-component system, LuxR family, response regulator FixJ
MSEPCICIVDDDAAVRDSVQALLESAGHPVRTFPAARAFLAEREKLSCSCLIADIRMPDMDGLTLQEELVSLKAGIPVIIITGHGDVTLAVRAMKAGAVDFIEKPFDDETLLQAVDRAIVAGKESRGKASLSEDAAARVAALSARERQVLERLVAGKPNKVIAYDLSISPRTVEIHRANVMDKMQAKSLSELVRLAIAAGVDISAT